MAENDEPREVAPRRRHQSDRDYDGVKDSVTRDFLLRSGYSVNSEADQKNFALAMDYLRELYASKDEDALLKAFTKERREARLARIHNRTRFIIWLLSGVGLAVIGASVTDGARWLHFLLPQ